MTRRRISSVASAGSRRSAMGEYIPPPGEQPLSSHALPIPSPADYSPSTRLTLPQTPRYSLRSRPYPLKSIPLPSPSDYDTAQDAVWENRAVSLTRKDVTWPYNTRKDAHVTCSPGPAIYYRTYGDTGAGPRQPVSARHREGINAGYPNPMVQPVDTHGFNTPGCRYRPESERGAKFSIGTILKKEAADTLGPGPGGYTLPTLVPPTPLFGENLHIDNDPQYPAANAYTVPGTTGTGQAKSFGITTVRKKSVGSGVAPNRYSLRRTRTPVAHSITYRPFPVASDKRPGPAEYKPPNTTLHHSPEYICREQCRPVFPDILHYPEHVTMEMPGAGAYEYDREFDANSKPAHSIGLPHTPNSNKYPAPNHYRVNRDSCSRVSPRYSIGQKLNPPGEAFSFPGPAEYNPRPPTGTSASITPRRSKLKEEISLPAPNNYVVEKGQTNRGRFTGSSATMKGRPTPVQYSGFPSSHLAKLASLSAV